MRSLSDSERVARIADELEAVVGLLDAGGAGEGAGSDVVLSRILRSAVSLFARHAAAPFAPSTAAELRVTPTEACTVAAVLLRSQELTPFEFSVWFSATGCTREAL